MHGLVADQRAAQLIEVEEIREELGQKRGAVREDARLDPFKRRRVHALRIVGRLQQERRNGRHEHGSAHVVGSVLAKVAGNLAASHGEADEGEVVQVERGHELSEVFREGVVIVAARRLAGVAEPSAVVCDDSVARTQEVRDLLLPGGAAERPSMNQHDGFPGPVILVIDLDRRRILLTHRNAAHCTPPVGRMPVWSIWPFSPGNSRGTQDSRAFKSGLSDRGSSGQVGPQHPFLLLETASDLNVDILRGKVLFAPVDAPSDL